MDANVFGDLLDTLIRERCRTIAAFCEGVRALGHSIDHGQVSKIINGSDPIRRPPQDQIDAWSRVLRLSAKEAKTFRLEALLTHTPDEIVTMLRGQLAREERHRRIIADLAQRVDIAAASTQRRPSDSQGGPGAH